MAIQPMPKQSLHLETVDYLAQTTSKIQQLPEPLIAEVNDFIDFMFIRQDHKRWQQWNHFYENLNLSESDFSDYLANLETYEERLARGEIQW